MARNASASLSVARDFSAKRPFSRYQADTPPMTIAVEMKAPITMCGRRTGKEGLKITFIQSSG